MLSTRHDWGWRKKKKRKEEREGRKKEVGEEKGKRRRIDYFTIQYISDFAIRYVFRDKKLAWEKKIRYAFCFSPPNLIFLHDKSYLLFFSPPPNFIFFFSFNSSCEIPYTFLLLLSGHFFFVFHRNLPSALISLEIHGIIQPHSFI
jgi:hypothetical protein